MKATGTNNWHTTNQGYLMAALAVVRRTLKQHARGTSEDDSGVHQALKEASDALPAPSALEVLCATLGLSPFERDVLLLCAGMELDSTFASLCGEAQGDPLRPYPTFSLAMAALPDAHWSAFTPEAPLRRWRLIEVGAGSGLVFSPLRIDEWVLHYIAGVPHLDERLVGFVEPLRGTTTLVPSHSVIAEWIVSAWSQSAGVRVIQLCGNEDMVKRAIAAVACTILGANLCVLPADLIPLALSDLDALIRLWEREASLNRYVLLLECDEFDIADSARMNALKRLIERIDSLLIVASRERLQIRHRQAITFDVRKLTIDEQRSTWHSALGGEASMDRQIDMLISQFSLSATAIRSVCAEVQGQTEQLWDACRAQTRPRMSDLAQRIESKVTWEDLVLPDAQCQTLYEINAQVRQRMTVYETWGFGQQTSRGLGISALFVGASGTGKTLAAEVLARELRLDLYRIDLSSVVSKYIGETEKNLRRVFDAAEEGGAVLLFDEADALFGKRSEVKDSHDRYANIEVSYLLQRMETYRGLAILTTNMKSALDTAFLRRIRFIVQFPFPDAVQRAEIWRRIFPPATPTDGLDIDKLARLNVAGGNIRNIALNAAFLAADEREPVRMHHLLRAAQSEYTKMEKSLAETGIGGWV